MNEERSDVFCKLAISQLRPGKYQPRSHMDEASLDKMAAVFKMRGVTQPILVIELSDGNYEIIAGESRWRAAQMAGLGDVPALVRKVTDENVMVMALIENIQREDLNQIEETMVIQRLIDEYQMSIEMVADAIGRSSCATSNLLELLKLSQPVQELMFHGDLERGHAKILLSLEGEIQVAVANKISSDGLSVRAAERLVQSVFNAASGVSGG